MRPSLTSSDFRHTKESEEAISSPSLKRARSPIRRCSTPFAGQLSADGVEGGAFRRPIYENEARCLHDVHVLCYVVLSESAPSGSRLLIRCRRRPLSQSRPNTYATDVLDSAALAMAKPRILALLCAWLGAPVGFHMATTWRRQTGDKFPRHCAGHDGGQGAMRQLRDQGPPSNPPHSHPTNEHARRRLVRDPFVRVPFCDLSHLL